MSKTDKPAQAQARDRDRQTQAPEVERDTTRIPRHVEEVENRCIQARRVCQHLPQLDLLPRDSAAHENLPNQAVGISLSGGGVRSASFNLGLLQALIKH